MLITLSVIAAFQILETFSVSVGYPTRTLAIAMVIVFSATRSEVFNSGRYENR
jgi:hypothetical protein